MRIDESEMPLSCKRRLALDGSPSLTSPCLILSPRHVVPDLRHLLVGLGVAPLAEAAELLAVRSCELGQRKGMLAQQALQIATCCACLLFSEPRGLQRRIAFSARSSTDMRCSCTSIAGPQRGAARQTSAFGPDGRIGQHERT